MDEVRAQQQIGAIRACETFGLVRQVTPASGTMVTLPYTVELNDIPMMMVQYHSGLELYDRAMDQFQRLSAEAEHSARVMAIAVHPYITGVPHRIGYFEQLLDALGSQPGVVFWTGVQILDWYLETRGAPPSA